MRIILADHHAQALWALKTLLVEQPEFQLVGEAENTVDLIHAAKNLSTDLILVDWELPGCPIADLIKNLHTNNPRPVVIVMSSKLEYGSMLLKSGADAFVSKTEHPDWLLETLHKYSITNR